MLGVNYQSSGYWHTGHAALGEKKAQPNQIIEEEFIYWPCDTALGI